MADISIDRFTRQIQDLTSKLDNLESRMSSLSGGSSASSPGTFTGSMNRGRFGSGVNFLQNSMGTLGSAMGALAAGATATSMLLPDVGTGMAREAVFYETGLRTGSRMGRDALGATVGGNVMPYLSFAGADAVAAGTLASGGVLPGSTAMGSMGGGGLFELAARTSSNLTGLFNIETDKAAASQAQFYSGGTAAALLRAGVFSRDPNTGEQLSQTQIFDQLANRLIRRDLSAEELGEELRSGMLGQQIESLPFDEITKDMFTTFLFERSEGRVADFSDQSYIDSAIGRSEDQGFRNIYREESEMQRTESDRLDVAKDLFYDGAKQAFDSLISLKEASDPVTESFGKLGAYLQTIFGDRLGQGTLIAGSGAGAAGATALFGGLGIAASVFGSLTSAIDTEGGESNVLVSGFLSTLSTLFGGAGLDDTKSGNGYLDLGYSNVNVLGGAAATMSSAYGELRTHNLETGELLDNPYKHKGIDFAADSGTDVTAAKSGEVINNTDEMHPTYGYYVDIRHADGTIARYAHLKSASRYKKGDQVPLGKKIGEVGNTGMSSGPHLHLGLYENEDALNANSAMDPSNLLTGSEIKGIIPGSSTAGIGSTVNPYQTTSSGGAQVSRGGIVINVSVQQASKAEAIRLAEMIKDYLEDGKITERMASR